MCAACLAESCGWWEFYLEDHGTLSNQFKVYINACLVKQSISFLFSSAPIKQQILSLSHCFFQRFGFQTFPGSNSNLCCHHSRFFPQQKTHYFCEGIPINHSLSTVFRQDPKNTASSPLLNISFCENSGSFQKRPSLIFPSTWECSLQKLLVFR